MGHTLPLMLVAMPSSGSDWLAGCIERANPDLQRPPLKEFFTPIVNLDRYAHLASVFGCETTDSFHNIARQPTPARAALAGAVIDELWRPEWRFTKEVWLGFQTELLASRFHLVGLVRTPGNTFPPTRLRVWQWYGAIADSLIAAGGHDELQGLTLRSKAVLAHEQLRGEIIAKLAPVIHWEDLVSGDRARVASACALLSEHVDPHALAAEVLGSASPRPAPKNL